MTDIVESTQAAGELGDERWAATLIRHDAAVRDDIDRHGGECIKFTGDGYLATFQRARMPSAASRRFAIPLQDSV